MQEERSDRPNIVGVRFTPSGKVRFFAAGDVALSVGDAVEVESELGPLEGVVVIAPGQTRHADLRGPLTPITRKLNR